MPILSCSYCSGEFEAKSSRATYCSWQCRGLSRSNLSCFICGEAMQQGRTSKPQGEAAHDKCRNTQHGSPGYDRGCRCDECRAGKAARMREYVARKTAEEGISPSAKLKRAKRGADLGGNPPCFICGETLRMAPRTEKRPMHKSCRAGAPNWLRYDLPNPKIEAFRRKIDKAAAGTSGKRTFTCGGCDWCAEYFVGLGKYCSKKCRDEASHLRRGSGISFKISKRSRLEIYERDNWTCQLCMRPVDRNADWRTPWYPTLDHIIPQSKMLVPDHSPSNLRLAHMWCNSARGDGSNMTEAAFHARIAEMEVAA